MAPGPAREDRLLGGPSQLRRSVRGCGYCQAIRGALGGERAVTTRRESWPKRLRDIMDGRPARWAEVPNLVGDYDGRERTLEVFNADAKDQRMRRLRPIREELELAAGGPAIVIF